MKRIFLILAVILLFFSSCAHEEKPNSESNASSDVETLSPYTWDGLRLAWEYGGYPEDVGGIYLGEDGVPVIVLVDLINVSQERKNELVALLREDSVAFRNGVYSYNELDQVLNQIQIHPDSVASSGFVSAMVDVVNNRVLVFVKSEEQIPHYQSLFCNISDVEVSVVLHEVFLYNMNIDNTSVRYSFSEGLIFFLIGVLFCLMCVYFFRFHYFKKLCPDVWVRTLKPRIGLSFVVRKIRDCEDHPDDHVFSEIERKIKGPGA